MTTNATRNDDDLVALARDWSTDCTYDREMIDTIDAGVLDSAVESELDRNPCGWRQVESDAYRAVQDRVTKTRLATRAALQRLGKVAVLRTKTGVALEYKGHRRQLNGSAVRGCDYRDEFVQARARELRDTVDKDLAAFAS